MTYQATVYEIIIASPSDLEKERKFVRDTVFQWNTEHSRDTKIMFNPVMWETDTVPEANIRPQESINRQIIHDSDIMVAMFWSKIGSSTGTSPSGTVEEINLFIAANKPVALYFSDKSTPISNIDTPQLEALREYRRSISNSSYYNVFKSTSDLKQLISKYLTVTAQKLSHRNLHSNSHLEHPIKSNPIPLNNNVYYRLFDQTKLSNSDGYWLSVLANYNNGYTNFESEQKKHIVQWATQLLQTIFPQGNVRKQYGSDFVIATCPINESMHPIFRVHYSNAGVVLIQWRGSGNFIPLDWIIVLCLVSVIQVVNSPIVTGISLNRIGIILSNAPEQGINTSGVFASSSTDVYHKSRISTWESEINDSVDIDSIIKEFVSVTLSAWGYFDFENNLDKLILKIVKQEFLLRQRGLYSFT